MEYITARQLCFSTAKLETTFLAPLRYGDEVIIEVSVAHVGNRSATLHHRFVRNDGVVCAAVVQTIVSADLLAMKSHDMPDDVRAHLMRHAT